MVPPNCIMPPTERGVNLLNVLVNNPSQPLSKPKICLPFECAIRVTARIAAFIPGASPPGVTTPIIFNNSTSLFKALTELKPI
jgi:hypothetical protein